MKNLILAAGVAPVAPLVSVSASPSQSSLNQTHPVGSGVSAVSEPSTWAKMIDVFAGYRRDKASVVPAKLASLSPTDIGVAVALANMLCATHAIGGAAAPPVIERLMNSCHICTTAARSMSTRSAA